MSLFIDQNAGADTNNATVDLFTISWNDSNLGQGPDTTITAGLNGITSITGAPVTYTGGVTTGQATANRLLQLATTSSGLSWANPIVVTALFGGNDPYSGLDVTGNGFTYVDTNVTPNIIHVAYDTSQANGQGLALLDTNGDPIQSPNAVILYHELSHALHSAINQLPFPQGACPGDTTDEPAAEIDENVLRTQLGLCLRDVCNHGGFIGWGKACGGSATPGGPPLVDGDAQPPGTCDCFVVTAATGTPYADEIVRLRLLRDRLAARSRLAGNLVTAIYAEYESFSPQIAARIALDPAARATVRKVIVGPLLAWHVLAEQLARDPQDTAAVSHFDSALEAACDAQSAGPISAMLQQVRTGAAGPGLSTFVPDLSAIIALPFAAWAVLKPLTLAWTRSATQSGRTAAVAEWLSEAPLEALPPCAPGACDHEFAELAALFNFAPAERLVLGARLALAWPPFVTELARHGFAGLPQIQPEGEGYNGC